jgi:hypothetical protein
MRASQILTSRAVLSNLSRTRLAFLKACGVLATMLILRHTRTETIMAVPGKGLQEQNTGYWIEVSKTVGPMHSRNNY